MCEHCQGFEDGKRCEHCVEHSAFVLNWDSDKADYGEYKDGYEKAVQENVSPEFLKRCGFDAEAVFKKALSLGLAHEVPIVSLIDNNSPLAKAMIECINRQLNEEDAREPN